MKDQEHAHVSGEFDVLRERERISCYFCNLQGATVEVGRKTRCPDRTPSVLAAPKVLSGADAACAQRPANLPRVSRGGEGSRDESAERDVVTARDAEKQVYRPHR